MPNLTRLRSEHSRLIAITDEICLMCARAILPQPSEIDALRRDLAETLIGHLKVEDWMLYPDLLESNDPRVVHTARAFCAEMGGLAAAFLDYSEKWSSCEVTRDWPGFCRETAGILAALRSRIDRENNQLYPLLETMVVDTLRVRRLEPVYFEA